MKDLGQRSKNGLDPVLINLHLLIQMTVYTNLKEKIFKKKFMKSHIPAFSHIKAQENKFDLVIKESR